MGGPETLTRTCKGAICCTNDNRLITGSVCPCPGKHTAFIQPCDELRSRHCYHCTAPEARTRVLAPRQQFLSRRQLRSRHCYHCTALAPLGYLLLGNNSDLGIVIFANNRKAVQQELDELRNSVGKLFNGCLVNGKTLQESCSAGA